MKPLEGTDLMVKVCYKGQALGGYSVTLLFVPSFSSHSSVLFVNKNLISQHSVHALASLYSCQAFPAMIDPNPLEL